MTDTQQTIKSGSWRLRPGEARLILLVGDLVVAFAALIVALYIWGIQDEWLEFSLSFLRERVQPWFYLLPLAWLVMLVDVYDLHRANNWRATLTGIAIAALVGAGLYALVYLVSPPESLPRIGVGIFLICAFVLTMIWRMLYIRIFTAPTFMRRVLIIGAGVAGATLLEAYHSLDPAPFHLIGFIDDDPAKIGTRLGGHPILGNSSQLMDFVETESVSDIVVAISGEMRGDTFQTILDAQDRGIEITPMPSMYEELLGRVPIHHLESDWVLRSFVVEARVSRFYEVGKRLLDILVGLFGLTLFIITFPMIALAVLCDSGLPILYSQTRSGKGVRTYRILKVRTMRQDAEADGKVRVTQRKDKRITRVGKLLRLTHLDEFPQFWNVLRGEMSLIGPRAERPELVIEYEKQIPFYRARLLVKPGITGWAQINYGYVSTIEETAMKLEYDLYYIKHRSLLMDGVIALRTFGQMLGFRGR